MSDTSGLQNADAEGVPAEERPERFEAGSTADAADAQAAEPPETAPGEDGTSDDVSEPGETGVSPEGAQDVTTADTTGGDAAEPPPADFDPAQQPSNPDLVQNTEPPD
ncbi:hypothetical protein IT072_19715 [Leifsonia sp. ZF2019]|uniref:hypothetical protein n=1 Tax=Leifsonia sp. ZF2019 TaxID=2781978 RepID=UPI001CBE393D|nr:hypothetical protein [Leifsonia sp. ZF2019]UAJ79385.1 hypothetical protein IT072_19715 [Leifsonia sp. ZF2019]